MRHAHDVPAAAPGHANGWLFALLCGGLALGLCSCMASNVVAVEGRDVETREDTAVWKPAERASIPGLYHSGSIEGDAAASLLAIYYYFDEDGSYTGAALVGSNPPAFQVLSGRWSLLNGKLLLGDDTEPGTLEAFEDLLRISTSQGKVVLHRDEIR